MSKAIRSLVAGGAVFALGLLSPVAASAATGGWMVNKSLLIGTKALAATATVDHVIRMTAGTGDAFLLECHGSTIDSEHPEIIAPNKGAAISIVFTGCESIFAGCELSSTQIRTVPVLLEATLDGSSAVKATISPRTKTVFATFEYVGQGCQNEVVGLTGHATLLMTTGSEERTVQEVKLLSTGELKFFSSPVLMEGAALFKLASSETWSFL